MPKLSIITINRNNAKNLCKTIESVIAQTFTDYEYIIIDGESTDGSVDVIRQYEDKITYWVSESDNGIYNAMNKGIKVAQGEYVQFLNSGDWLCLNTILEDVFKLNRNEDVLYGNDLLCYDKQRIELKTYPQHLSFFHFFVGTISHEGTFHRRCLFDQLYNESNKIVSDWEFQIQKIILSNCTTYKLDKAIVYFDMSGISQSPLFEELQNAERKSVLEKYFPKRVLSDYEELKQMKEVASYSLYSYVKIFSQHPRLQRLVRGFMKLLLKVTGNSHLIPRR